MTNRWIPLEQRFWMKVEKTEGCWLWTGARWASGYGQCCHQSRRFLAHRVAWELLVGPIPEGLTIDHVCLNKSCVNPAHLEVTTRGENARRHAQALTHCKHGHPFDEANTYRHQGDRYCRTCRRELWHTSNRAAVRKQQRWARRAEIRSA